ncbi:MAG: hypothetical protein ACLPYS_09715 [Vulcanimicrobiaceae bacterium]|jgi:hypothetical protein
MQPKDDYRDPSGEELEEPAIARRSGSIEIDQLDESEIEDDDLLEPTTVRGRVDADVDEARGPSTVGDMKQSQRDNAGVFDDIKQSWKDNGEVLKEMKREITGRINPEDDEQPFEDDTSPEVQRRSTR